MPRCRSTQPIPYNARRADAVRGTTKLGPSPSHRLELKPFTDKQIALVETFADQAVIAIENVRLFNEIQDKSRQSAEASQHKSQLPRQHEP